MKSTLFWDIMPCSPLKVNRCFWGTYRLHLEGRRISQARNHRESRWQAEPLLARLILRPWRWRRYVWHSTDYTALYPRRLYPWRETSVSSRYRSEPVMFVCAGSPVSARGFFLPAAQQWRNATERNCWALRDDGRWAEGSCKGRSLFSICEVPPFWLCWGTRILVSSYSALWVASRRCRYLDFRMVGEWRTREDLEGSGCDIIEGLKKTTKNLSQDSVCPGRNFNQGSPESESRATPVRSV
jgi:hypothetical protein